MAVQKPSIPKGTRDFGPAEVQKRKYILNTIETVFKKYGFMPIETPTMENLSTLEGKYGDEGDKLLFRVLDSGEYFEKLRDNINPAYLSSYIKDVVDDYLKSSIESVLKTFSFEEISHVPSVESKLKEILDKHIGSISNIKLKIHGYENAVSLLNEQIEAVSYHLALAVYSSRFPFLGENFDKNRFDEFYGNFKYNYLNKELIPFLYNKLTSAQTSRLISEKGLRYDLTVPFARYVVMNRNEITFPFKRYQMQPVWRADRPQKGRYREFWQCDADVVGSDSLLNEVDLILIYKEVFRELGIHVEIKYNNRKLLDGLSHILGISDKLIEMTIILDKQDKIGLNAVVRELKDLGANPVELNYFLDALSKPFDALKVNDFFNKNETSKKGMEELNAISRALNILNNRDDNGSENVQHDLSLARGLSYYTGAIFEVVVTDERCSLKSSIGGGGRYDNLTGIFGLPNVSGVGISFGLDRIYDVMEELNLFKDIESASTKLLICAFENETQLNALGMLKQFRDQGIASELYPELPQSKKEKENPLQKPMNYADALKIPFRLIIKQDSMILKDIDGKVVPVNTIDEIITYIK